ncbi:Protein of unknown function, partial [Gryllus bimaculatus]
MFLFTLAALTSVSVVVVMFMPKKTRDRICPCCKRLPGYSCADRPVVEAMVVLTAWSLAAAAAVVLGASTCFCLLPEACRLRLSPCLRVLPFPCGPKRRPPEPERERVERVPQFAARRPPPVERPVPVPFARR